MDPEIARQAREEEDNQAKMPIDLRVHDVVCTIPAKLASVPRHRSDAFGKGRVTITDIGYLREVGISKLEDTQLYITWDLGLGGFYAKLVKSAPDRRDNVVSFNQPHPRTKIVRFVLPVPEQLFTSMSSEGHDIVVTVFDDRKDGSRHFWVPAPFLQVGGSFKGSSVYER